MSYKFNPFTGKLDKVSSEIQLTISSVIKSILLDKNESALPSEPYISILFDEDSILFNDDEAL
jgi:hypothetical protein